MIARINGREKTKQDLQVHLGKAMLRLGGEVRLGKALLRLGGSESSKTQALGSPRQRATPKRALLRIGVEHRIFQKWAVSSFSP